MSTENFKPIVWAELINKELEKNLVFGTLANREYEGIISGEGSAVKIHTAGSVTVKDYDGSEIDFEEMTVGEQILKIDKSKYIAFAVDDVDRAQMKDGLMEVYIEGASYQLADVVDISLASLFPKANSKIVALPGDNLAHKITDLATKMDEDNVPTGGRWLVLSPGAKGELVKALPNISKGENTFGVNQSNYIGEWAGFEIFLSNNVQKDGPKHHCMAGQGKALNLAMQISQMEAGRMEKKFSDFVKGLNLFGADVTETDTIKHKTVLLAELEVDVSAPKVVTQQAMA